MLQGVFGACFGEVLLSLPEGAVLLGRWRVGGESVLVPLCTRYGVAVILSASVRNLATAAVLPSNYPPPKHITVSPPTDDSDSTEGVSALKMGNRKGKHIVAFINTDGDNLDMVLGHERRSWTKRVQARASLAKQDKSFVPPLQGMDAACGLSIPIKS